MRASLKGALGGGLITAAAVLTLLLGFVAPMLAKHRAPTADESRDLIYGAAGAALIVLTGSALAGLIYGASAALSRGPRRTTAKRQIPAPQTQLPFSQRLGQFLGEDASTEPSEPAPRSRMAFFSAIVPGRRYRPKPASYIRRILWRIRRLLAGS